MQLYLTQNSARARTTVCHQNVCSKTVSCAVIAELDTVSDRNPVSGDAAARDYHLEQAALHAWEGKSGAWGGVRGGTRMGGGGLGALGHSSRQWRKGTSISSPPKTRIRGFKFVFLLLFFFKIFRAAPAA